MRCAHEDQHALRAAPMRATALLHVTLPVTSLERLAAFYVEALGFTPGPVRHADPARAALPGVIGLRSVRLHRGAQVLELAEHHPPGAPYPVPTAACDLAFQHVALTTGDVHAAQARLAGWPHQAISRGGPQTLPGGIVALKFRDPDGHPLELICLPDQDPATADGIDHSAIAVSHTAASIAFYEALGFRVASRQVNAGPAQDALDGLDGVRVDVVGLAPAQPAPHLELLGYRTPAGRTAPPLRPADIAASRLVLLADVAQPTLLHDPDGHAVLLVPGA